MNTLIYGADGKAISLKKYIKQNNLDLVINKEKGEHVLGSKDYKPQNVIKKIDFAIKRDNAKKRGTWDEYKKIPTYPYWKDVNAYKEAVFQFLVDHSSRTQQGLYCAKIIFKDKSDLRNRIHGRFAYGYKTKDIAKPVTVWSKIYLWISSLFNNPYMLF